MVVRWEKIIKDIHSNFLDPFLISNIIKLLQILFTKLLFKLMINHSFENDSE